MSLNFPGRTRFRGCQASPSPPPPTRSLTSRPQRDGRLTCTRLGGGCSSRVRTQAPPDGSPRRCRRRCHRRCHRRACREPPHRGSPATTGGAIRVPAAPTSRAPLPRAARTGAESPLLARLSQLRGAGALPSLLDVGGDSLPLVDARGGNSLPGVTGTGGGDSPAGMTRWAGIPESPTLPRAESLRVNSEPHWALASEISVSWGGKDGARWQLRIYRWRGLGRHLGGRAGARGLEVAFAQHFTRH